MDMRAWNQPVALVIIAFPVKASDVGALGRYSRIDHAVL
jgi:hypothetical protein